MNILSILSTDIDMSELQDRLSEQKLSYLFSDFGFCPFIISYKNPETTSLEIVNVNDGFYKHLTQTQSVITYTTIEDFISNVMSLKNDKLISEALF